MSKRHGPGAEKETRCKRALGGVIYCTNSSFGAAAERLPGPTQDDIISGEWSCVMRHRAKMNRRNCYKYALGHMLSFVSRKMDGRNGRHRLCYQYSCRSRFCGRKESVLSAACFYA